MQCICCCSSCLSALSALLADGVCSVLNFRFVMVLAGTLGSNSTGQEQSSEV